MLIDIYGSETERDRERERENKERTADRKEEFMNDRQVKIERQKSSKTYRIT